MFDIAPNCPMNYFMTCFGYAYKDGGIIACFIIFFIFGSLCNLADQFENKNDGTRSSTIKILMFLAIMFSMTIFPFAAYITALPFFYTLILTSKLFSKQSIYK